MISVGRLLMIFGLILLVLGGLIYLAARFNLPLGRLPGDIHIVRDNISCFFPLTTMILLSIVGTLLLNLAVRLLKK